MPDWRVNAFEGIYKFGAVYPVQKRYQILADYATIGSFAVSERENRICYNTARGICEKFIATSGLSEELEQEGGQLAKCNLLWQSSWRP